MKIRNPNSNRFVDTKGRTYKNLDPISVEASILDSVNDIKNNYKHVVDSLIYYYNLSDNDVCDALDAFEAYKETITLTILNLPP